jgi:hypothetical protein
MSVVQGGDVYALASQAPGQHHVVLSSQQSDLQSQSPRMPVRLRVSTKSMPYGLSIGKFNTAIHACTLKLFLNREGGGCMCVCCLCMYLLCLLARVRLHVSACVCIFWCLGAGQCVAAFDHFCPLLATAVGDVNRARFW